MWANAAGPIMLLAKALRLVARHFLGYANFIDPIFKTLGEFTRVPASQMSKQYHPPRTVADTQIREQK